MSAVFDILAEFPPYSEKLSNVHRLKQRRKLIIDPVQELIEGTDVLDLGCHDGRWALAFAAAGARSVHGVEARGESLARFDRYPCPELKERITLRQGDLFDEVEDLARDGRTFGIVAALGVFYHIMDHFWLLRLISHLRPKVVIIDSEFIQQKNPIIQLGLEDATNPLNATEVVKGMDKAIKGVPSIRAMELMAAALGYKVTWLDHAAIFGTDRKGVKDYFRQERKRRMACHLTPEGLDPGP